MSKKVLVLSGSPRIKGNSDLLCDEFIKGANEVGHQVEKINIRNKKIGYCNACYYCKSHDGECVIKDDMAEIMEKMITADVIVMSSPVYFYSIDGQMKTLIDRTLAKWTAIKNKEFYYIMTSADEDKDCMNTTLECFRGFAVCTENPIEKGIVYGCGYYEPGTIKNSIYMQQSYEMGKAV